MIFSQIIHTPLGDMIAQADDTALLSLDFCHRNLCLSLTHHPILDQTTKELDEYFSGTRRNFTLPLAPDGTEFQQKAWKALTQIPYGETRNYSEQAYLTDNPKAIRAIG